MTNNYTYIVRKYIKAKSFADALRKEKDAPVHDMFLEDASRSNLLEGNVSQNTYGFKPKASKSKKGKTTAPKQKVKSVV